ncbi:hypothetical protein BT63DRAFT_436159 [Microthyrium microscopicum]|uniref:Vezatin n=1 Tax=Microthyrium microscopicum TaxID=703497 RepID=A0A6A6UW64_9PEZI|nr:hypothetical protein BT63DRAFT_436159 [Microthyrium microscopicum]
MEVVIDEDSPLARSLLEGKGLGLDQLLDETNTSSVSESPQPQFAPHLNTTSTLQDKLRKRLGRPLRIAIPHKGPVARIHLACTEAVTSKLSHKENEKFLEHFRYTLIASNLLSEQTGRAPFRPAFIQTPNDTQGSHELELPGWTIDGAMCAVGIPAIFSGLMRWTFTTASIAVILGRLIVVVVFLMLAGSVVAAQLRRQKLQSLRQKTVRSANISAANFQALDQSSNAALTMVREVELISRGYRLSSINLPPITMLDENTNTSQSRRCTRIRRLLSRLYLDTIPILIELCNNLQSFVPQDDLEKYLDIHEIAEPDVKEAFSGALISEIDDQESLSALRAMQWRFNTLRKVFLCHLLALPATGCGADIVPWQNAEAGMESIASTTGEWAEKINEVLGEDEIPTLNPTTPTHRNSPERERYRQQLRKTNELSAELRAMQAKLHILRDDVSRILDGEANINAITPLFNSQADAIGQDIRLLQQTYDSWRTSLLSPADKYDRRRSRASSELRSPASLGGLTVVDEGIANGPSDALRALTGVSSGSSGSPVNSNSDEEVFEAMALPRIRRSMTREEKIAKLQDEEARRSIAREQRQQTSNMVRELETVINTRFSNRMSTGRIPHNGRITSL